LVKKPRLLLAVLALLIGAASAAGARLPPGANDNGEAVMMMFHKQTARSGY
jgi:hypothetical protein